MAIKKVGLTTYGFSIQNHENQRSELHNVFGLRNSLISIIENYANANNEYESDDNDETVFSFFNIDRKTVCNNAGQEIFTSLCGIVKTGEYGIESELVDHTTGQVSHNRTTGEADVMPFGFGIFVPAGDVDNGVIIIQSIGIYGMKVALHKKLNECMREALPGLKFEMGVIVPKVILDRFFDEGVLKTIRLIRYEIPRDMADQLGINYGVQETYEERIIRKPRGFLQNKRRELTEWRNGARNYADVISIDGFECDDLKMEFNIGRTSKTISLKNIDNIQVCEDITDDVVLVGGHPTFDSLVEVMDETAEFYLRAKNLI